MLVLSEGATVPFAVGKACQLDPHGSADALMLGLISFVTHFDHKSDFDFHVPTAQAQYRYRLIAVLAADIALLSGDTRRCRDLAQLWTDTQNDIFCQTDLRP